MTLPQRSFHSDRCQDVRLENAENPESSGKPDKAALADVLSRREEGEEGAISSIGKTKLLRSSWPAL